MLLFTVYLTTVVIFLGTDVIGLRYIVKPVFDRQIGDMLLEAPRYGPALVFYLFYIGGVVWFVSAPALRDGTGLAGVALNAAIIGAIGYGTYEFSNFATLKGWTWGMVATDLIWGIALTTFAAVAGVAITRAFVTA